jgi:hypothetical protein
MMKEFWIPDLEVYGLENFGMKSVLKEMSGLRIKKNKILDFNARFVSRIIVGDVYQNKRKFAIRY